MKRIDFQNNITKVNKATFDEFQNNIEEASVIVSPTEPTTNEKVWIQKGKNLFNGSLTMGSINESGVEQSSNNSARSENYLKVVPNKNYIVSYNTTNNATGLNVVTFYDENRAFISRIVGVGKNTFVTPENCKYLRLTFYNSTGIDISVLSNIQLEQSSIVTEYEAYIDKKIKIDGEEFLDVEKTNNQQNYSTAEQVIGTWIDGKPLYRKVIDLGPGPNAENATYNLGIPAHNIKFSHLAFVTTNNNIPIPYNANSDYNVNYYFIDNNLLLNVKTNRSDTNVIAILEYTKD